MLKVIYFFNWVCISVLAVFVILLLLEPKRGGGDAATRGLGEAYLYLSVGAMVILLLFNLLPWKWSKYLAFALILSPFLLFFIRSRWARYSRALKARVEAAKPIFQDPDLDRLARLIQNGEPQSLQERLSAERPEIIQSEDLLWYAIQEASGTSYRGNEKTQCVRILLDAGAPLDKLIKGETPVHSSASNTGNAAMLRLLFEHGVDANTRDPYFDRPYLFDAVASYIEPLASVQAFLDHGADPNAKAVFDTEEGPVTPLIRAAQFDKWDICALLIERGADPHFTTATDKNCAYYTEQAAEAVSEYGSPETNDKFRHLQALLKKAK